MATTTATTTITVSNPLRSRQWGWDYRFAPDTLPGTITQRTTLRSILRERASDRTYQAHRNAYGEEALYYAGRRVLRIDGVAVNRSYINHYLPVDCDLGRESMMVEVEA